MKGSLKWNRRIVLLLVTVLAALLPGCLGSGPEATGDEETDEPLPWIDTHAHPMGIETTCLTQTCLDAAVATMDAYGVRKTIFMHPPAPASGGSEENESEVQAAVLTYPDRFFYGAGGNVLNSLIQRTPDSGVVPAALQQEFEETAQGLVDAGGLVVFGETAALHLSYSEGHAFEETPPNTTLFLSLADLAAANALPIDIHMDVVEETMATPTFFTNLSPNNPSGLQGNVAPFEELLDHNTSARIVWAHVGRDTTRDMTAELVGRLLAAHSNLYIQIHPVFVPLRSSTAIVNEDGTIRPEWLDLLEAYPDRAVIGSDNFYNGTDEDAAGLSAVQNFLEQLLADLADQIGCTNPVTIYNLPSGC